MWSGQRRLLRQASRQQVLGLQRMVAWTEQVARRAVGASDATDRPGTTFVTVPIEEVDFAGETGELINVIDPEGEEQTLKLALEMIRCRHIVSGPRDADRLIGATVVGENYGYQQAESTIPTVDEVGMRDDSRVYVVLPFVVKTTVTHRYSTASR